MQRGKNACKSNEEYFHFIGAPVRLSEVNIDRSEIQKIAENAVGLARKWGLNSYTQEVIARILEFAT